jgi:hypothetical protein
MTAVKTVTRLNRVDSGSTCCDDPGGRVGLDEVNGSVNTCVTLPIILNFVTLVCSSKETKLTEPMQTKIMFN